MTPKKLTTRQADPGQAKARRVIAAKYLEVAELISSEDGAAANVCVGLAVLAGIAAGDAKPGSHYGEDLLSDADRKTALRCAAALVQEAQARTL